MIKRTGCLCQANSIICQSIDLEGTYYFFTGEDYSVAFATNVCADLTPHSRRLNRAHYFIDFRAKLQQSRKREKEVVRSCE